MRAASFERTPNVPAPMPKPHPRALPSLSHGAANVHAAEVASRNAFELSDGMAARAEQRRADSCAALRRRTIWPPCPPHGTKPTPTRHPRPQGQRHSNMMAHRLTLILALATLLATLTACCNPSDSASRWGPLEVPVTKSAIPSHTSEKC